MQKLYFLSVLFLLAGCSFAPKPMDELKTARFQQARFVLQKDYASLAACWDKTAKKPNDILGTSYLTTSTQTDKDRGITRMQVGGEAYKLYHLVLELQEKSAHETYVEIYANEGAAPVSQNWIKVLKDCAKA